MLRDLLKEGGLYTLANLLTKGVSLLLIPFYTSYFSTADYGIIDMLSIFGAFFNGIFSLQLYQGLGRYTAGTGIESVNKKEYVSTGLFLTAISFTIFLLLVFLFHPYISYQLIDTYDSKLVVLCSISMGINSIFYYLSVYIRFERKAMLFAALSFVNSLGNILLILFLVIQFNYSIESIFLASIYIGIALVIFELIYLRKHIKFSISKTAMRDLFLFSVPLIPATISYLIMNFTDRWFIKEYLSLDELGVYGIGYKFSSVLFLVITSFSMAMGPIVYEKHLDKDTPKQISKLFNTFTYFGTFFILIISLFAIESLEIFTNEAYYSAQYVMPIFYYTVGFSGVTVFAHGLRLAKKTRLIAYFSVLSAVVNVVLNYLLIPNYGLFGAALSTFIGTALYSLLIFYFSQKEYYFKSSINIFYLIIMVHGAILGLTFYYEVSVLFKIGICIFYLILLFFVRKSEFRTLLKMFGIKI